MVRLRRTREKKVHAQSKTTARTPRITADIVFGGIFTEQKATSQGSQTIANI
jgi:hypothetical protein